MYNNHSTISFTLLTKSHFWYHRLIKKAKKLVMFLLGKKIYGPVGVVNSLLRGLQELKREGIDLQYNIDPSLHTIHSVVCVLSGADTLKYAIALKKTGIITTIFAGPNISLPKDKYDIFFDKRVDKIIVPSQRVADYFVSLDAHLSQRILVWPAGVEDTGIAKKHRNTLLIYKKTCPQQLFAYIIGYLEKYNIAYDTIVYGSFTKEEYQTKINNSRGLIYLQESESQGLALQEAWIKDIPTLVWNRGYREYQGIHRSDTKVSAPYLEDACGMFFSSEENFEKALQLFLEKIQHHGFAPRQYCLDHLTDKICAKKYINILN